MHLRTTTSWFVEKRTTIYAFFHIQTTNNLFAAGAFRWSNLSSTSKASSRFQARSSQFPAAVFVFFSPGEKKTGQGLPVSLPDFYWWLVSVALGEEMIWLGYDFCIVIQPSATKHEHEQMIFVGTYILLGTYRWFFIKADLERWNFLIFMLRSNAAVVTVNWWIQCSSGKVHREWSL